LHWTTTLIPIVFGDGQNYPCSKETNADAIHPGYGFLSENEDFARKVKEAGLIFIGPSAASMEIMGSKLSAKAAVSKFNVPLVPGTSEPISNVDAAKKTAGEIGYPILIKASAGGGGKGMRIVEKKVNFKSKWSVPSVKQSPLLVMVQYS